jgi:two-component system, cell cycle response regulator
VTEADAVPADQAGPDEASLQESIAGLLASQGNWREAYEHLRSALDLTRRRPLIPEQLRREVDRLRRERAQAREDSLHDALTTVYNRRYLDLKLADLLSQGRTSLAVALVDIDLFKDVNDTFGHLAGDQVLRGVAALLAEGLPPRGFCVRYGGEEFMLVLPGVSPEAAVRVAEHARTRVAEHSWSTLCPGLVVTVSVGLAYEPGAAISDRRPVLEADHLLYAAKRAGRNRVAYRDREDVRLIEYGQ